MKKGFNIDNLPKNFYALIKIKGERKSGYVSKSIGGLLFFEDEKIKPIEISNYNIYAIQTNLNFYESEKLSINL
jgi:hypothetical protein